MATEILKLTAEVVISHASMTELSTQELVEEIKEIYGVLSSLECRCGCQRSWLLKKLQEPKW